MKYRVTEQRTVLVSFIVEAEDEQDAAERFLASEDQCKPESEEILDSHGLTVQKL